MIRQNPEDIDPDQWLDEGELTEILEIPREEAKERVGIEAYDPGTTGGDAEEMVEGR